MMTSLKNIPHFTIEKNVIKGEVISYDDDHTSFGEFILRVLENNPDLVGQIDAVTDEEWTYEMMRERSVRCALWMKSQGLVPRDVIALCSENRMDYAMPCFAALYLGAIFNPWDATTITDNYIRHQMNIAKPKMVFVSEASAPFVAEAASKEKLDLKIIVFGRVPGFLEFDSVIAEPEFEEVKKFRWTRIKSSEEIAAILLSSGTTGFPKGVALSHRSITMSTRPSTALGTTENFLLSFSAVHWFGSMWNMFFSLWLKLPRANCVLLLTPYMVNRLVKSRAMVRHDLSSLTVVNVGGGSLPIATYREFKKLLPKVQITSNYGMTESPSVSFQSTEYRAGLCGEVMRNCQLKVVDPDTGRTLGPNRKGEMLLKSGAMMSFYYGNPQATAETIDDEGFVHSGDIGYYDENGTIFFTDRMKDIIRRQDDDISPSEIETVIMSLRGVKEVAVVGQPHLQEEDLLIAFVVRDGNSSDSGSQVTEEEIKDLVATKLPENRRLGAGVRFIDCLPRTTTDKVRRKELRDLARSMVRISSHNCVELI